MARQELSTLKALKDLNLASNSDITAAEHRALLEEVLDSVFIKKEDYVYSTSKKYFVNDVVVYQGQDYICISETADPAGTFDSTKWKTLRVPLTWSNQVDYITGDIVEYSNKLYKATSNSTNVLPTNTSFWSIIPFGGGLVPFSATESYTKNQVVLDPTASSLIKAKSNLTAGTFNPLDWDTVLDFNVSNVEVWNPLLTYVSGDVVFYNGIVYKCITPNPTTIAGQAPDNYVSEWQSLEVKGFVIPQIVNGYFYPQHSIGWRFYNLQDRLFFFLDDVNIDGVYTFDDAVSDNKVIEVGSNSSGGGNLSAGDYGDITVGVDINNVVNSLTIDNSAVNTDKLADNAVTDIKIAYGAVKTDKITDGNITLSKIQNIAGPSVLGKSTSTGTPEIITGSANTVLKTNSSNQIVFGQVVSTDIADNSIETNKINAFAVTDTKLANNSVTEFKIQNNAVTEDKILIDAVTTAKIKDNNVTLQKLAKASSPYSVIGNNTNSTNVNFQEVPTVNIADAGNTQPKLTINDLERWLIGLLYTNWNEINSGSIFTGSNYKSTLGGHPTTAFLNTTNVKPGLAFEVSLFVTTAGDITVTVGTYTSNPITLVAGLNKIVVLFTNTTGPNNVKIYRESSGTALSGSVDFNTTSAFDITLSTAQISLSQIKLL